MMRSTACLTALLSFLPLAAACTGSSDDRPSEASSDQQQDADAIPPGVYLPQGEGAFTLLALRSDGTFRRENTVR